MRIMALLRLCLPLGALLLGACAPVASTPIIPTAHVELPSPMPTLPPTAVLFSFQATTYKDEAEGFALDYPSDWTAVPSDQIGPRGSQAALRSPGTTAEAIAPGGSRVGITVYLWDPKGDLAAYVTHRRSAWDASGSTVVEESEGNLTGGWKYKSFVVKGPDGAEAFFLFTTLGEKYLEISGEGDLALVEEIAHTLRPLP